MGISGQKRVFFGRTGYQKKHEYKGETIFKSIVFQLERVFIF